VTPSYQKVPTSERKEKNDEEIGEVKETKKEEEITKEEEKKEEYVPMGIRLKAYLNSKVDDYKQAIY
jgi:hypothetical protein